ncbi:hypothetical protein BDZ89DRAFT_1078967 [Hymenopellis radicata]|nr:hypothetical protein BDZ89DRAFT_1078967 [Hymenopellis radicata]
MSERSSPIKPRPRRLPNLDIATGEAIFTHFTSSPVSLTSPIIDLDLRLSSAGSGSASCSNRRRSVWAQKPQSLQIGILWKIAITSSTGVLELDSNDHLHTVVQQIGSCQKPDERLKLPDVATIITRATTVVVISMRLCGLREMWHARRGRIPIMMTRSGAVVAHQSLSTYSPRAEIFI